MSKASHGDPVISMHQNKYIVLDTCPIARGPTDLSLSNLRNWGIDFVSWIRTISAKKMSINRIYKILHKL